MAGGRKRAAPSGKTKDRAKVRRKENKRRRVADEEMRRKFDENQRRKRGEKVDEKNYDSSDDDARGVLFDEKGVYESDSEGSSEDEREESAFDKLMSSYGAKKQADSDDSDGKEEIEEDSEVDMEDNGDGGIDDDEEDNGHEEEEEASHAKKTVKEVQDDTNEDEDAAIGEDRAALDFVEKFQEDDETSKAVLQNARKLLTAVSTKFESFPFSTSPVMTHPDQPVKLMPLENINVSQPFSDLTHRMSLAADAAAMKSLAGSKSVGLSNLIHGYSDVYVACADASRERPYRTATVEHILAHVTEMRERVIRNNSILKKAKAEGWEDDVPEDVLRDQGFTRAKILILVPFRHSAYLWVRTLLDQLFASEKSVKVENFERFLDEYGPEDPAEDDAEADFVDKDNGKPADYRHAFRGNVDDCFRFGIALNKKRTKLFSHLFSSDIVIASPLGLKMLDPANISAEERDRRRREKMERKNKQKKRKEDALVAEKEEEADADKSDDDEDDGEGALDFLSSLEVCIVDRMHVIGMQNFSHCEFVFRLMNSQPRTLHRGTDVSRVRHFNLSNDSLQRRQTLLFSEFYSPEQNALFTRFCANARGHVRFRLVYPDEDAQLAKLVRPVKQVFHRVDCAEDGLIEHEDARFAHFMSTVVPRLENASQKYVLLVVPSYFDFVKVRNALRKRVLLTAVYISEYTHPSTAERSRQRFREGDVRIMVATERYYFFIRKAVSKARHVVFYSLPENPQFYAEILNNCDANTEHENSAMVLYVKYDHPRAERVCGTDRIARMLQSGKKVHMFT